MSDVYTLPLPKRGKTDIYFIASDWHDQHMDNASFNILIQLASMLPKNKRKLIINGDFVDLPELMERSPDFRMWIKRVDCVEEYFLPAAQFAYEWGNTILDKLQETFSEIVFIEGNHDWRIKNFRDKYCERFWPQYSHNFSIQKHWNLEKRKIKFVPYNDWLDLGSLAITHGCYHGPSALKKHYEAAGKSVIFGHVHQAESKSFTKRGHTESAWSLPCMSTLAPEYMKNRPNSWSKGFGEIRIKANGHFNFYTHQVWDGELVSETGKIICG